MITAKNCFIQFSKNISGCDLPIQVKNMSDINFFINDEITSLNIDIVTIYGMTIREFVHSFNFFSSNLDLSKIFAPEDCFRLRLTNKTTNEIFYSNVFVYVPDTAHPLLSYWSNKNEFGFHYEQARMNSLRLPLYIYKPGYEERAEKYTDANGRVHLLTKDIRKKYTLQTDYMPLEWHDKLKIALSHDVVMIDEKEIIETGNYTIENTAVELDCHTGYMAETEVAENFVERNTNC